MTYLIKHDGTDWQPALQKHRQRMNVPEEAPARSPVRDLLFLLRVCVFWPSVLLCFLCASLVLLRACVLMCLFLASQTSQLRVFDFRVV